MEGPQKCSFVTKKKNRTIRIRNRNAQSVRPRSSVQFWIDLMIDRHSIEPMIAWHGIYPIPILVALVVLLLIHDDDEAVLCDGSIH